MKCCAVRCTPKPRLFRLFYVLAAAAVLAASPAAWALTLTASGTPAELAAPPASTYEPAARLRAPDLSRLSFLPVTSIFDHTMLPRLNIHNWVTFNVKGGLAYSFIEGNYTNLRTPDAVSAAVYGINDQAARVGSVTLKVPQPGGAAEGVEQAVMWSLAGKLTQLGALGGDRARATGINQNGQVTGLANTTPGGPLHAFIWDWRTGMRDLGMLNGASSYPFSINGLGHVLGVTQSPSNPEGFLWTPEKGLLGLGNFAGAAAMPMAINDLGQVVGYGSAGNFSVDVRGFFRSADGVMTDLGTLGGTWAYAMDINNKGQVTGVSGVDPTRPALSHPFIWTAQEGMKHLGTLSGKPTQSCSVAKINNAGQIVGQCGTTDTDMRAFIWSVAAGMRDVNSLVMPNTPLMVKAITISDMGSVLGVGNTGALMLFENIPFSAQNSVQKGQSNPMLLRSPFGTTVPGGSQQRLLAP
jgi:probable HAF family extracellular repeat protein